MIKRLTGYVVWKDVLFHEARGSTCTDTDYICIHVLKVIMIN